MFTIRCTRSWATFQQEVEPARDRGCRGPGAYRDRWPATCAVVQVSPSHLFGMLGQAGVSVRMISQSCDEINIIIGVEEKDFDLAIRTIYRAFSDENGIVKVSDLEASAPVDALWLRSTSSCYLLDFGTRLKSTAGRFVSVSFRRGGFRARPVLVLAGNNNWPARRAGKSHNL